MTDQTTETRVAEIEKRAVDALGIGAFGKAVLVCRTDIPWLTAQLRAAWKREAALREALLKIKGITGEAFNTADYMGISKQMELKIAKVHRIAALQETADE